MSSDDELFLEAQATSATPALSGKARAKARALAWKRKMNARTVEEFEASMNKRLFPHLTDAEVEDLQRLQREIEERMERERLAEIERESHSKVVEPIIEPEIEEFQSIELPAVTVPLVISIQDIFSSMRQRVGPSLDDWCPLESLYRLSMSQFLYYVDPDAYPQLAPSVDYENFECIVRCIQLNAPYYDENMEIIPKIDHLSPRCITLESIDRYRRVPPSLLDNFLTSVIDFDLTLIRATNRDGEGRPLPRFEVCDALPRPKILPDDYSLKDLLIDAKRVARLLRYVLSSDSGMFRPRRVFEPQLPSAPYLAILNQLPIRELARRVADRISTSVYPCNSKLQLPLEPRIIGENGYISLIQPDIDECKELVVMVSLGDLPSGSHSAWDGVDSDDDY